VSLDAKTIIGLILVVGGILAIVMGGFTYTEDEHSADLGPIELSVEEKETVNIPLWMGVAGVVLGVVVLSIRRRGR
jgi:uncharacterized membrane protein YidH (DUF202 family)